MIAPRVNPGGPKPTGEPVVSAFAADPERVEWAEWFVGTLPETIRELERAAAARDFGKLDVLSHQLKGAAGGFGFPTITQAAGELEKLARTGQVDKLAPATAKLVDLCKRARARH